MLLLPFTLLILFFMILSCEKFSFSWNEKYRSPSSLPDEKGKRMGERILEDGTLENTLKSGGKELLGDGKKEMRMSEEWGRETRGERRKSWRGWKWRWRERELFWGCEVFGITSMRTFSLCLSHSPFFVKQQILIDFLSFSFSVFPFKQHFTFSPSLSLSVRRSLIPFFYFTFFVHQINLLFLTPLVSHTTKKY